MTFVAPNLVSGEARGGRIPCHGAVTDEQRSHRPNSAQHGGRQVFFAQTSLLAPHRSTAGYARRSRLVWAKNPLPRTSLYLCLRPLSERFVPKGPCDNSPAFQRWGPRPSGAKSRRDDRVTAINQRSRNGPFFCPSGTHAAGPPKPSDESLYVFSAMVGTARRAVPARAVA